MSCCWALADDEDEAVAAAVEDEDELVGHCASRSSIRSSNCSITCRCRRTRSKELDDNEDEPPLLLSAPVKPTRELLLLLNAAEDEDEAAVVEDNDVEDGSVVDELTAVDDNVVAGGVVELVEADDVTEADELTAVDEADDSPSATVESTAADDDEEAELSATEPTETLLPPLLPEATAVGFGSSSSVDAAVAVLLSSLVLSSRAAMSCSSTGHTSLSPSVTYWLCL